MYNYLTAGIFGHFPQLQPMVRHVVHQQHQGTHPGKKVYGVASNCVSEALNINNNYDVDALVKINR